MARDIALAAYGRADKKVNQDLALRCWKNNGCTTGTGGKLTVAYVEGFGENVYRQISKMESILQALTYKNVGKIIYTSAHSDPAQARRILEDGLDAHGESPGIRLKLAELELAEQNRDAALDRVREALSLHPDVATWVLEEGYCPRLLEDEEIAALLRS